MKRINSYIMECGGEAATPGNTIGMGNPMNPTETEPGSEPLPTGKSKKQKLKMKKSLKDYILKESTFEAIEHLSRMNKDEWDYSVLSLYWCTGASERNFKKYKNEIETALEKFMNQYSDDIQYYEGNNIKGIPTELLITDFSGNEYLWDFKSGDWQEL